MKVRALTLGVPGQPTAEAVASAGARLARAAAVLSDRGFVVQSRRVVFGRDRDLGGAGELDAACAANGVDFCSVGMVTGAERAAALVRVLCSASRLSGSVLAASAERGLDGPAIRAACEGMLRLAFETDQGLGNFRFGAAFCVGPGTPFFPAGYHDDGAPALSIGMENSDLLVQAFERATDMETAASALRDLLAERFGAVESAGRAAAQDAGCAFRGLDTSIAPSLAPEDSVVRAFDALGVAFGRAGTLALCGLVTRVLRSLPVAQVGYRGIMLPLLEDVGLAAAAEEGRFGIAQLLACSSVCGVGVDTVPVAGDVPVASLSALMLDIATMALRLDKPLLGRLLPVPGKRAGEKTSFDSPHLCNSVVLDV